MSIFMPQPRGAGLLLIHCNAMSGDGPNAYSRLEERIGNDLARLLVFALAGGGPQGRRASSSP
jgi:hypothetical protein